MTAAELAEKLEAVTAEQLDTVWGGMRLLDNFRQAAARLRSMEEALSREERAHEQTVDERDIAQATADRLADLIAQITGVEIGEHRAGLGCPGNDPHLNAIDAAEGFLHARAALSGEGQ